MFFFYIYIVSEWWLKARFLYTFASKTAVTFHCEVSRCDFLEYSRVPMSLGFRYVSTVVSYILLTQFSLDKLLIEYRHTNRLNRFTRYHIGIRFLLAWAFLISISRKKQNRVPRSISYNVFLQRERTKGFLFAWFIVFRSSLAHVAIDDKIIYYQREDGLKQWKKSTWLDDTCDALCNALPRAIMRSYIVYVIWHTHTHIVYWSYKW